MQFVYQGLTWGFLLALLPLLIHLINLMRHRRVQWAAMEFLLQSHKKHRKWVWLRQLALLLMRMAAIALLVAMLAQWVTRDRWFALFGGTATHHYVLLDDSYSMSQRRGGSSAFDSAKRVVSRLAASAGSQDTQQKFTLIRFSRAAEAGQAAEAAEVEQVADFNAAVVDPDFDVQVEQRRNSWEPTQLPVGPRPALELVDQLLSEEADENRVVYLVSDFRAKEWDAPAELRAALRELQRHGAQLELVDCAEQDQSNLGITSLSPAEETRAAGVPLFVNVQVRNFGKTTAQKVQLNIRTRFYEPATLEAAQPGADVGVEEQLPTVLIDEIAPGATVERRVQVYFPQPGQHVVEASLPEDPVAADNLRWCVVDLPEGEPVLVVDSTPTQHHAYFLQSVFQPGPRANTGIRPEIQSPAYLRDATLEQLQRYHSIYLLDVARLDERAVQNLEAYARAGGGVAFFAGEQTNLSFYNQQLYRDGDGLFPLPLARDDLLPPSGSQDAPDLIVADNPVFRVFSGQRNPLIRLVTFERYLRPPEDWQPGAQSQVEVLARLRNQQPLVVERQFGAGRVVAFLTTLAPDWNNWGHDPSFVVVALQLQSYLAAPKRSTDERLVGTPLQLQLEAARFRPDVSFVLPGEKASTRIVVDRMATAPQEDSPLLTTSLGEDINTNGGETDHRGIYEAWLRTTAGALEVRRWAYNVEPAEGDLTATGSDLLLQRLEPVVADYRSASNFDYVGPDQSGFNPSLLLMGLLVSLLLGEQFLAYLASYHPPRGAVR